MTKITTNPVASPIRLVLLTNAFDTDGEARAGLLLPPAATAVCRRPVLRLFATIGAAVSVKRELEGGR